MPRGYRRIIFTAFGCLILAGAGPPNNDGEQSQAAKQTAPALPAPPAPSSSEPKYRPYPDYKQDDCYRYPNYEGADLCAQWRAAVAAEKAADRSLWANWIGVAGALLSFASVILVLIALRQGRDANRLNMAEAGRNTRRAVTAADDTAQALEHAQTSAAAASALVKVSQDTADAQLRAYLDFDGVGFLRDEARDDAENVWSGIYIRLKNFGHTPATSVQMTTTYFVIGSTPQTHQVAFDTDKQFSFILPTDTATSNGEFAIPKPIWHAVKMRDARVIVQISVTYVDYRQRPRTLSCTFESNGAVAQFGFVPGTREMS